MKKTRYIPLIAILTQLSVFGATFNTGIDNIDPSLFRGLLRAQTRAFVVTLGMQMVDWDGREPLVIQDEDYSLHLKLSGTSERMLIESELVHFLPGRDVSVSRGSCSIKQGTECEFKDLMESIGAIKLL